MASFEDILEFNLNIDEKKRRDEERLRKKGNAWSGKQEKRRGRNIFCCLFSCWKTEEEGYEYFELLPFSTYKDINQDEATDVYATVESHAFDNTKEPDREALVQDQMFPSEYSKKTISDMVPVQSCDQQLTDNTIDSLESTELKSVEEGTSSGLSSAEQPVNSDESKVSKEIIPFDSRRNIMIEEEGYKYFELLPFSTCEEKNQDEATDVYAPVESHVFDNTKELDREALLQHLMFPSRDSKKTISDMVPVQSCDQQLTDNTIDSLESTELKSVEEGTSPFLSSSEQPVNSEESKVSKEIIPFDSRRNVMIARAGPDTDPQHFKVHNASFLWTYGLTNLLGLFHRYMADPKNFKVALERQGRCYVIRVTNISKKEQIATWLDYRVFGWLKLAIRDSLHRRNHSCDGRQVQIFNAETYAGGNPFDERQVQIFNGETCFSENGCGRKIVIEGNFTEIMVLPTVTRETSVVSVQRRINLPSGAFGFLFWTNRCGSSSDARFVHLPLLRLGKITWKEVGFSNLVSNAIVPLNNVDRSTAFDCHGSFNWSLQFPIRRTRKCLSRLSCPQFNLQQYQLALRLRSTYHLSSLVLHSSKDDLVLNMRHNMAFGDSVPFQARTLEQTTENRKTLVFSDAFHVSMEEKDPVADVTTNQITRVLAVAAVQTDDFLTKGKEENDIQKESIPYKAIDDPCLEKFSLEDIKKLHPSFDDTCMFTVDTKKCLKVLQVTTYERLNTWWIEQSTVSLFRSIQGFPLLSATKSDDRESINTAMKKVADALACHFIRSNTDECSEQEILQKYFMPLLKNNSNGSEDWPEDRAIIAPTAFNKNKQALVKVNFHEHMEICCQTKGGALKKALAEVLKMEDAIREKLLEMNLSFKHDKNYGYLNSDPQFLGLGMEVRLLMIIPLFREHPFFDEFLKYYSLKKSFYGRKKGRSYKVLELVTCQQFGNNETQVLERAYEAADKMIEIQRCLQHEVDFASILPDALKDEYNRICGRETGNNQSSVSGDNAVPQQESTPVVSESNATDQGQIIVETSGAHVDNGRQKESRHDRAQGRTSSISETSRDHGRKCHAASGYRNGERYSRTVDNAGINSRRGAAYTDLNYAAGGHRGSLNNNQGRFTPSRYGHNGKRALTDNIAVQYHAENKSQSRLSFVRQQDYSQSRGDNHHALQFRHSYFAHAQPLRNIPVRNANETVRRRVMGTTRHHGRQSEMNNQQYSQYRDQPNVHRQSNSISIGGNYDGRYRRRHEYPVQYGRQDRYDNERHSSKYARNSYDRND